MTETNGNKSKHIKQPYQFHYILTHMNRKWREPKYERLL